MGNIRTIAGMWLAGVGLLSASVMSLGLSGMPGLGLLGFAAVLFLCCAVPLMLLAWGAAMCKAVSDDEGGWAFAMLFLPGVVMWVYLFVHLAKANPGSPAPDPNEPLWMRQARVAADEAESRGPQ